MPTQVRKRTVFDPADTFAQHISLKTQMAPVGRRVEALKKSLKDWLEKKPRGTYVNENGSVFYDLPVPVVAGGKTFTGMELRRSAPVTFDEEEAEKILKKKDVYDEALSSYIDQDKVYALFQEDKITEKDLDKIFVEGESWAFWPVVGD